jgi:hypothetical protein
MGFLGDDPRALLDDADFDDAAEGTVTETWFGAGEGLRSVAALKQYLDQHAGVMKQHKAVRDELEYLEQVLVACREQGVRWHLSMDF